MFAAMFVIGAGSVKSGLLDSTKNIVMRYQNRPKIVLLVLMLVATVLSILTSAVGTMAILLPLIINIANNLNISRSKFIYPVAMIATIATACTFLGQGAANMNWSDVMVNMGGPVPFGIWDFTIARIPVIVTTIIYGVFVSQYLLPDIPNSQFDTGKPVVEKTKTIDVKKQRIAQIICSFTIIGMIVLDYFSLVPMYIVACIGAVLLILFGVLSEMEAISSIHGPTMFLFIGVLPLSDALKMTGAADVVASLMRTLLGLSLIHIYRMQVGPGSKDYGALSLAVQYYAEPYIVANVPPNCFIPRPGVGSAVIRLTRHQEPPVDVKDAKLMFRLIRASFNQRRKTLLNGLANSPELSFSKEQITSAIEKLGLPVSVRGETLTLEQFDHLSNLIGGEA